MVKTFKSREHKEGVDMKGFLLVTLQCGHDNNSFFERENANYIVFLAGRQTRHIESPL